MAKIIKLKDIKTGRFCFLSGETLAKSAINENVGRDSLLASIDALCNQSPSSSTHKKAFRNEAIQTYDNSVASHDVIKNNFMSKEDKQND